MSIPSTTKDKIKQMFLDGHVLTSCGAAEQFVTADLRKYISTLRREGMNITDERVTSDTGKSYKKYWLKKEENIIPISTPIQEEIKQVPVEPEIINTGQQALKFG